MKNRSNEIRSYEIRIRRELPVRTFSMALYHKWDVKNGFAYVLKFFTLISDGLGGVSLD